MSSQGGEEENKASMSQQLQVLNALDVAKTQWYHFTAIVIAGMGFFTDAYDLFCISLVTKLLGRIYYHVDGSPTPGSLPPQASAAVNGVAFVGTLSGQLFFGWLGDKMGRKRVYGMTLMIMVICSIASGLSFGHDSKGVMATLCFFRFWLGFGIGGDYPLSATIMSEYANKRPAGVHRRRLRHAGRRHPRWRHGSHRDFLPRSRTGSQAPPYAIDPLAPPSPGRLRLAHNSHVRVPAGGADLLLADEDAGDGAVHRPRGAEREAGGVGHVQGPAGGDRGGAVESGANRQRAVERLRPLLQGVPPPPRPTLAWHRHHLVPPRHRLLQPEPLPEGHLHRHRVDPQGRHHERARGGLPNRPGAEHHRALRHRARLLVYRRADRHHRPVHDPTPWVRHDDDLHAGPRHPVPPLDHQGSPDRLRRHVRLHLLLRQLRAQQHHVHRASGDLPARLRSTCHGISLRPPGSSAPSSALSGSSTWRRTRTRPRPTTGTLRASA
ncbi:unnamed protein product [Musa acuminata subsp. burmannicoides]